jgi:hypothetical protein
VVFRPRGLAPSSRKARVGYLAGQAKGLPADGDRKGTWALHVTRKWRLTFRIDNDELIEVNHEDYH